MTERETWTKCLPDVDCHRAREHAPHANYEGQTAVSYCSGVGASEPIVSPPADPFAYLDDED